MGEKIKGYEVFNEIPDGWKIDNTVGSPVFGCKFITNGKSLLNGQQRALLKLPKYVYVEPIKPKEKIVKEVEDKIDPLPFPSKTVNQLARLKFKEQLLKEILFDLTVCEIEGWDKKEYIEELKELLNGIDTSK